MRQKGRMRMSKVYINMVGIRAVAEFVPLFFSDSENDAVALEPFSHSGAFYGHSAIREKDLLSCFIIKKTMRNEDVIFWGAISTLFPKMLWDFSVPPNRDLIKNWQPLTSSERSYEQALKKLNEGETVTLRTIFARLQTVFIICENHLTVLSGFVNACAGVSDIITRNLGVYPDRDIITAIKQFIALERRGSNNARYAATLELLLALVEEAGSPPAEQGAAA
jgi:hypothetical protein